MKQSNRDLTVTAKSSLKRIITVSLLAESSCSRVFFAIICKVNKIIMILY